MIRYFSWLRFISIFGLTGLFLAGCTPKSRPDDDTATFAVESLKGSSEISALVDGFSIPQARIYSFHACLTDRRSREKLERSPFSVLGTNKEIRGRTDDAGCFHWSEEIRYNHLADEKYLTLRRTLRAEGLHAGARQVLIAINPWQRVGKTDVVDLERDQVPPGVRLSVDESSKYVAASTGQRTLWTKKLSIENTPLPSATGVVRKLRVSLEPGIVVRDFGGQNVIFPLTAARLKAHARLIAVTAIAGQDVREELDLFENIPLVQDGDFMRFEFSPVLKRATQGTRFQLELKLIPQGGPIDLKEFSGLFSIGDFNSLTGAANLPVQLRESSYQPPKANTESSGAPLKAEDRTVREVKPFEIGEIKIDVTGIEAESALWRKVAYRATSCITDTANGGRPATNVDFQVEVGEGSFKKIVKTTKRFGVGFEGCVTWDDSIGHDYYEIERFIQVPVKFIHLASGFSEERMIALNPWDRFGFGADMKFAKPTVEKLNQRGTREPSRLINDGFGWETVKTRQYQVDEFLNLKVTKSVQLRLPMRVQRFSNVMAGKAFPPEPIRDGLWGVRALIHVPLRVVPGEISDLYSIMHGDYQIVRSISGDVKPIMDFDLSDTRLVKARATIVFEVVPIDESKLSSNEISKMRLDAGHCFEDVIARSSLVTPTFAGPVWAVDEASMSSAYPTDLIVAGGSKDVEKADLRVLAGKKYADVLKLAEKANREYRERMAKMRSLPGYLKNLNLDFVSLHNEEAILSQNLGLEAQNVGLPNKNAVGRLLAFMNYQFPKSLVARLYDAFPQTAPVSVEDLRAWVEGRKEMDRAMAARLCMVLIHEIAAPALKKPKTFFDECLKDVNREFWTGGQMGANLFAFDRAVRTFETDGGELAPSHRPSFDFEVGAEVGMERSQSISTSVSASFSPTGIIRDLLRPVPLLGAILGGASLSFTKSWSNTAAIGEGAGFASGMRLHMENVEMKVTLKRYENCASIRLRPSFWEKRAAGLRETKLTGEALLARLSRGLLVCTGFENKKPLKVQESFFAFSQGPVDGTRLDKGDLINHPYLISLRGQTDYVTFLDLVGAKKSSASQVNESFDVAGYPAERLAEAYKAYRARIPSQPGFYVLPAVNKTVESDSSFNWWGFF